MGSEPSSSFFHNLLFLGRISLVYDSNRQTPPSPLGFAVAIVPAIGAVVVIFLVRNFAPEAKGHGVPERSGASGLPLAGNALLADEGQPP